MLKNKRVLTLLALSLFISVFAVSPALAGESDYAVWSPAPEENPAWTITNVSEANGLTQFDIITPDEVPEGTKVGIQFAHPAKGFEFATRMVANNRLTGMTVNEDPDSYTLLLMPDNSEWAAITGITEGNCGEELFNKRKFVIGKEQEYIDKYKQTYIHDDSFRLANIEVTPTGLTFDLAVPSNIPSDDIITLTYTAEGGITYNGTTAETLTVTATDGKITGLAVQDGRGTLRINPACGLIKQGSSLHSDLDDLENIVSAQGFEIGRVAMPNWQGRTFFEINAPKYIKDGTNIALAYTGNGGILPETATVTDGKITGLVVQDVTGTLTITPDGLGPITIPGLAVAAATTEYQYNSVIKQWHHPQWQWNDRWVPEMACVTNVSPSNFLGLTSFDLVLPYPDGTTVNLDYTNEIAPSTATVINGKIINVVVVDPNGTLTIIPTDGGEPVIFNENEIVPKPIIETTPQPVAVGGFKLGDVSQPGACGMIIFDLIAPAEIPDGTTVSLSYTGKGGIIPATATVTNGKITGLYVDDPHGTLTVTPTGGSPATLTGIAEHSANTQTTFREMSRR